MSQVDAEVSVENEAAQLASTVLSTDTTITVVDGSTLPEAGFQIKIDNEVVLVGTRSGNTLEDLTRGDEGTLAWPHPTTSGVYLVVGGSEISSAVTESETGLFAAGIGVFGHGAPSEQPSAITPVVTTTPALTSYGFTQPQAEAIITNLNLLTAMAVAYGFIA